MSATGDEEELSRQELEELESRLRALRLIAKEFATGFLGGLVLAAGGLLLFALGVWMLLGGRP
jgi:predicted phage tail protein